MNTNTKTTVASAKTTIPAETHPHLIPKIRPGYIVTERVKEGCDVVNQLLHDNQAFILQGEAGAGKNMRLQAVCAKNQWPLHTISCSGDMRTTHILGRMVPDPEHAGSFKWQDGPLTEAVRRGLICCLDEINSVDPDILFALHQLEYGILVIAATSEVIYAHPDFRICGTMNPSTYFATKPLNQALLDRFMVEIVEYDPDIDATLIRQLGLTKDQEAALTNLIDSIRKAVTNGTLSQNFGHRTLAMIVKHAPVLGLERAFAMAYTNKLQPAEGTSIKTAINDLVGKIKVRRG